MAAWMQCSFIQTVPTWADAACNVSVDTHDGFDSNKKREEERRESQARLRAMLVDAVDPQAAVPAPAEAVALAAPHLERLESGRIRIDWDAIARDVAAQARLEALAAEHERRRLEFEADEEDVTLLLWN